MIQFLRARVRGWLAVLAWKAAAREMRKAQAENRRGGRR